MPISLVARKTNRLVSSEQLLDSIDSTKLGFRGSEHLQYHRHTAGAGEIVPDGDGGYILSCRDFLEVFNTLHRHRSADSSVDVVHHSCALR